MKQTNMTEDAKTIIDDISEDVEDYSLEVNIWYPRQRSIQAIQVGLVDVRATDSIRVSYDFPRNGWKIEQASKFHWAAEGPMDDDWQEVAFVESWARAETDEQQIIRLDKESDLA